jgi:DNA replicative helicase MCM subunit Mcm2 (Cdc46/Mcm family)
LASEDRSDQITLEDVETAISILQHFLRKMQRAQSILRQVEYYSKQSGFRGFGNLGFEDVMNIAWEIEKRKMAARGELVNESKAESSEGVLSPEEVAKMKELVKKIKGGSK